MKSLLGWLAPGISQANGVLTQLLKHGTAPEVVATVGDAMKAAPGVDDRQRLVHVLGALIPTGGHICAAGDRLALLGPSGVGKSSAIIKLTLFETQRRQCQVGWVSTDQRRLTTGDPLAVYAGILGVRYETAESRQDLKHALDALRDCDLVLVDTAGANPRDDKGMKALAKLLHGFPDLRRTLLLSAATNGADMADWLAIYRKAGLHALMFTKLDECRFFGSALGAALTSGLPLSYFSRGDNFTGDIEIAEAEVFASLALRGVGADD
jgi:flagellar biosynthesis protein FlhF